MDRDEGNLPDLMGAGDDSQGSAAPAADQPPTGGSAGEPTAAGAAAGTKGGEQTVPLARFQEAERLLKDYEDLGLKDLADQIRADPSLRFDLMAALARRDAGDTPPAPPTSPAPPAATAADPNAVLANMRKVHEQDPVAAGLLIASTVAAEQVKQVVGPINKMVVQSAIDSFKAQARANVPYFSKVERAFDRLVSGIRAELEGKDPEVVNARLSRELVTAFGTGYLAQLANQKSKGKGSSGSVPPNMGSGGGGAGGEGPVAGPDKDVLDVARYGGMTEEEVRKLYAAE